MYYIHTCTHHTYTPHTYTPHTHAHFTHVTHIHTPHIPHVHHTHTPHIVHTHTHTTQSHTHTTYTCIPYTRHTYTPHITYTTYNTHTTDTQTHHTHAVLAARLDEMPLFLILSSALFLFCLPFHFTDGKMEAWRGLSPHIRRVQRGLLSLCHPEAGLQAVSSSRSTGESACPRNLPQSLRGSGKRPSLPHPTTCPAFLVGAMVDALPSSQLEKHFEK